MRISGIFEKINGRLFAAKFDNAVGDELDRALTAWRDVEYLRSFFMEYGKDLDHFDRSMKVQKAVRFVIKESETIYDSLIESINSDKLEKLFKPLDNREMNEPLYNLQKLKARVDEPKSMLRLYAIKLEEQYIVSGSAIKITERMDRPHLRAELHKLHLLKQHLGAGDVPFMYLSSDL